MLEQLILGDTQRHNKHLINVLLTSLVFGQINDLADFHINWQLLRAFGIRYSSKD